MKKIQDSYFHQAKRDGYAARSAYKLEEIDRKRRLLRSGMRVLDLGCAPGSWLQYAARRVGEEGRVVGVDLREVTASLPPAVTVLQADVFDLDPAQLAGSVEGEEREGERFDVILSDMAPATSGIKQADAARSAQLAEQALHLAERCLLTGGALLVKIFQGAELQGVRERFRREFEQVTLEKPKSSRSESVEVFLLGQGRRG